MLPRVETQLRAIIHRIVESSSSSSTTRIDTHSWYANINQVRMQRIKNKNQITMSMRFCLTRLFGSLSRTLALPKNNQTTTTDPLRHCHTYKFVITHCCEWTSELNHCRFEYKQNLSVQYCSFFSRVELTFSVFITYRVVVVVTVDQIDVVSNFILL